MKNAADRLIKAIERTKNPTVAGLDTQVGHIPKGFTKLALDGNAEQCAGILAYNEQLLELMEGIVPCVKVQIAYYEMLGLRGMYAFSRTLQMAREKGFITIADVKRGDIGATSEAYAKAYLEPGGDFEADFLSVYGYLGTDGVKPFVELCEEYGKGAFVLVKTSNPSSGELQDLFCGEETVYQRMGGLVSEWGKDLVGEGGYSSIGAVVGATYPEQGVELRRRLPSTFFLVPGYGAQGATGRDIRGCFDQRGRGVIVNASRSILAAHQKHPDIPWEDAAMAEITRMREDITG